MGETRRIRMLRINAHAEWMFSDANRDLRLEREESLRKLIQGPGLAGPERLSLSALLDGTEMRMNQDADFDPRGLLNSADIILAVDIDSEHEALVYGRDLLEQISKTGNESDAAILRIEVDMNTEDLERLVALVRVVKGRDDYSTGPAA